VCLVILFFQPALDVPARVTERAPVTAGRVAP
jgi:hypothetical protein